MDSGEGGRGRGKATREDPETSGSCVKSCGAIGALMMMMMMMMIDGFY